MNKGLSELGEKLDKPMLPTMTEPWVAGRFNSGSVRFCWTVGSTIASGLASLV